MKKNQIYTYIAMAGILVPVIYLCLIITLGLLEPGYSHLTNMMSVLGGVKGIRGFAFNAGIALEGVIIMAFSMVLHHNINQGKGSKIGPVMLFIGGLGLIGSAVFHCNSGCTNVLANRTLTGTIHMLAAFIAGMNLALAPFFIFARLRKDSQWKKYRGFTLAMAILGNVPGIIFWITLFTIRFRSIEGLFQRLGIVFTLIWIGVMSLRLLQLTRKQALEPDTLTTILS